MSSVIFENSGIQPKYHFRNLKKNHRIHPTSDFHDFCPKMPFSEKNSELSQTKSHFFDENSKKSNSDFETESNVASGFSAWKIRHARFGELFCQNMYPNFRPLLNPIKFGAISLWPRKKFTLILISSSRPFHQRCPWHI